MLLKSTLHLLELENADQFSATVLSMALLHPVTEHTPEKTWC
jgi:hypothetical protein